MNEIGIQWGNESAADFHALVKTVPVEVLNSPRRSVVPLLEFCRDPSAMLAVLERATDVPLADVTDLLFEYAVPVQKGKGKPSFTDLVILTPGAVVGIEAKYTEPEYESVSKWLRDPVETNRALVLSGWLDVMSAAASRTIRTEDVAEVPYQLVHRVASVCHAARPAAAVVYLIFGKAATHYAAHMKTFAAMLGDRAPALVVLSCGLVSTSRHDELTMRWDAGERTLGAQVRSAMLAAPLIAFDPLTVVYHSRRAT